MTTTFVRGVVRDKTEEWDFRPPRKAQEMTALEQSSRGPRGERMSHDATVERVARAIKTEIGRQFKATPAPPPTRGDDWSATGGALDLVFVARAAIAAMKAD